MERLLTAYQEDLLSLEQLRERMPLLRQREQTLRYELNALVEQTRERAAHLRLAETLSAFLTRLRATAETLDIVERQRIVRLVVKEVLVNDDKIVIRHCIPVPSGPPPTNGGGPNNDADTPRTLEVTFCVRGVITPPWGTPRLPPALRMSFNSRKTSSSSTRATFRMSCRTVSKYDAKSTSITVVLFFTLVSHSLRPKRARVADGRGLVASSRGRRSKTLS